MRTLIKMDGLFTALVFFSFFGAALNALAKDEVFTCNIPSAGWCLRHTIQATGYESVVSKLKTDCMRSKGQAVPDCSLESCVASCNTAKSASPMHIKYYFYSAKFTAATAKNICDMYGAGKADYSVSCK